MKREYDFSKARRGPLISRDLSKIEIAISLDKEVVEYGERLPAGFKVRNGAGKWLHREVCKAFLPATILRRKKRGFAMNVVDEWFRAAQSQKMEGMLLDPQSHIFDYLQPAAVRGLLERHRSGASDHHKVLFSLVVLEEWLRASFVAVA